MSYWDKNGYPVGRLRNEHLDAVRKGQTTRSFEEYSRAPAGSHPNAAPQSPSLSIGGPARPLGEAQLRRDYQAAAQSGRTSVTYEAWINQRTC